MKFSRKVFIAVFVTSLLVGSAIIWGTHKYVNSQTRESFISRYEVFSRVLGDTLSRLDTNTEALMLNAAQVVAARDAEKGLLSTQELKDMRAGLSVTHIFVTDGSGKFIRSTNEDPSLIPNVYSFCGEYRDMISGGSDMAATPIIHPQPEPKPYKFLFVPSRDRKRLLEIGVRIDFLAKTLKEALVSDANVLSMSVFDPKGTSFGRFDSKQYDFTETAIRLPEKLPTVIDAGDDFKFYTKVISSHTKCCQCEVSGTSKNGEYYYVLESVVSKKELNAVLAKTNTIFITYGLVMILIALIVGRFFTRRLVRNIESAATKIREIKETGNLDSRIELGGADEVSFLTNEFDHLLDSLKESQNRVVEAEKIQAKVLLAKQVAHNIRSPIITIEMMVPMMMRLPEEMKRILKASVKDIRTMADRLKSQADSMSVEPLNQAPELIFMPAFLGDLVLQKKMEYSECSQLKLNFLGDQSSQQAFAKLNSLELKSILSNLINNAAEAYGQRDGEIRVGLRADNGYCEISVSDDGAGIPEEYLAELGSKQISFKGGANRGVGLIHAFKAVESWGGRIEIESKVGLGTRIRLYLPLYAEAKSGAMDGQIADHKRDGEQRSFSN
jgi:signal transduction histidine kinase